MLALNQELLSYQVGVFSIMLLLICIMSVNGRHDVEVIYFTRICVKTEILGIISLLSNFMRAQFLNFPTDLSFNLLQLSLALTYFFLIYIPYAVYTDWLKLYFPEQLRQKKKQIVLALPLAVLIVLLLVNQYTHVIFYYDPYKSHLTIGTLFLILPLCFLIYGFLTIRGPLKWLFSSGLFSKGMFYDLTTRRIINSLVTIIAIVDILYYELTLFFPIIAVIMFAIMIQFQKRRISRDPLTGINNRNELESYVRHLFKHDIEKEHLFVLFMDVDSFKEINDRYGHSIGDQVLILIARELSKIAATENGCFLARYGGDEFIMFCNNTTDFSMRMLSIHISETLSNIVIPTDNGNAQISVSVGVNPWQKSFKKASDFIESADTYMYEQKRARKKENLHKKGD
ncbi:MAG: GGDEF domain-containing protein [Succinivibrio sp.]|nr:GGDEF domain-containing protein [Succinivibrio sp.]